MWGKRACGKLNMWNKQAVIHLLGGVIAKQERKMTDQPGLQEGCQPSVMKNSIDFNKQQTKTDVKKKHYMKYNLYR